MKERLLTTHFALSMALCAFFTSWVLYFINKDGAALLAGMQFAILAYIAAAILKK